MPVQPYDLTNVYLFDTETTGTGIGDQIIELGIINGVTGETVLQTFIKPLKNIPQEATNIHGITNEMVADAPTWSELQPTILKLIYGHKLAAYNVDFDRRMILQTASLNGTGPDLMDYYRSELEYAPCVMLWYAEYYGEPSWKAGQFKWQKLTLAAQQQDIDIEDLTAHRATSDCEITRRLINKVNEKL